MRMILTLALCTALAAPAAAQAVGEDEGFDLMEEGAKLLFQGLMKEVAPAMDELAAALEVAQPMLRSLVALAGDLNHYEMPERLPNGDIIFRRKAGAPPPPPLPDLAPLPVPGAGAGAGGIDL